MNVYLYIVSEQTKAEKMLKISARQTFEIHHAINNEALIGKKVNDIMTYTILRLEYY